MIEEPKAVKTMKNHNFCTDTIELCAKINTGFIILAERLYKIREERLFEPYWDSFYEFVLDMNAVSMGTVSRLLKVYQKYCIDLNMKPKTISKGEWSILYTAIPVVKSKDDALFYIETPNTRQAILAEIKEKKTGIPQASCDHEDSYLIRICRKCGDRHREYEDEGTTK